MQILQVASECAPVAKAGGLADVVYGLSRALLHSGHEVAVILPHYRTLFRSLKPQVVKEFSCELNGSPLLVHLSKVNVADLTVYLVGEAHPPYLLAADHLYGGRDDVLRMAFFSKCVRTLLKLGMLTADIVHCHDWPTALLPVLLHSPIAKTPATVLTLHNMESRGIAPTAMLNALGLGAGREEEYCQDPKLPKHVNMLAGGIRCANHITTVSPSYAREIMESPNGFGLEGELHQRHQYLSGIINGLDWDYWNPASDPLIPVHYQAQDDCKTIASSRQKIREMLLKRLRLEVSHHRPLFVTVSRLTPQKSPELMMHAIQRVVAKGGQYILLGSSPIPLIQQKFQRLKQRLAGSRRAHLNLVPDEELTHWMFAAADFVVVPSLFEPCGLTQLIGMRYGAIPLVRETGGLRDTVFDIEYSALPPDLRNGITFQHADNQAIDWAIDRAFELYGQQPKQLQQLQRQAMKQDHSWSVPAAAYAALYKSIMMGSERVRN